MCVGGTVMWSGFHFADPACTIVLFNGIRITSKGGLVMAVLITMLMGVGVEAVGYARRVMMATHRARLMSVTRTASKPLLSAISGVTISTFGPPPPPPRYLLWVRLVNSGLFGVALALAYALMLLAMTYNGWLFLAVIFGLSMGHFFFSDSNKVSPSAQEDEALDPCCAT
jgi:hypothetical protein